MQERTRKKRTDAAVSEVIGSVMLISVVVTAIAIIGVVLTSQPPPQTLPALEAIISSNGKDTVRIYHGGGDTVTSREIAILVDGVDRTTGFTLGGSNWTSWSPGDTLEFISGSLPEKVQILYTSGTSQTVLVSADFSAGMPTSVPTAIPTTGAAATVSGINPNVGVAGSSISANIAGSGFEQGAAVQIIQGASVITATNIIVVSRNQITCRFNLNGAATGPWDVTVTNPGSVAGTLAHGLSVITAGPAPAVTKITPNSGTSGSTVPVRNLTGTNFASGADGQTVTPGKSRSLCIRCERP